MALGDRITEAEDGTFTKEEGTLTNGLIDAVMAPINVMSAEKKYVSVQTAGLSALGYGLGGIFVGDRYGHKIPVIGGGERRA